MAALPSEKASPIPGVNAEASRAASEDLRWKNPVLM